MAKRTSTKKTIKPQMDLEKPPVSLFDEFKCHRDETFVCGPLLLERERSRHVVMTVESLKKEKEKYRKYFVTLLKSLETQISTPVLIKDICKSNLSHVKEIHSGYYFFSEQKITFFVFINEENWDAENIIYECYGDLLEQFPEKEIDLRLMRLWNREPQTLIPEGFQHW